MPRTSSRIPLPLAICLVALAAGCGPEIRDPPDGGTASDGVDAGSSPPAIRCSSPKDCDPKHPENRFDWICTPAKRCLRSCLTNRACPGGTICDLDGTCLPAFCTADGDCAPDHACLGGRCTKVTLALDVAACAVTPETALIAPGRAQAFTVEAFDAAGKRLATRGPVAWSATPGLQVTRDPSGAPRADVSGAGDAEEVRARMDTVPCRPAKVHAYGPATPNRLRIVAIDALTSMPVAGARVRVTDGSDSLDASTDSTGVAELAIASSGRRSISVFAHGHAYVTFVDLAATDVVARLMPRATDDRWTGSLSPPAFDDLPSAFGSVHFALVGTPLPANPADFRLGRSLGRMRDTLVDLGAQQTRMPLPDGAALGLGGQMFKSEVATERLAGTRRLWGMYGNADFSALTRQLGPELSGAAPDEAASFWVDLLAIAREGASGLVEHPEPASESVRLVPQVAARLSWEAELPSPPSGMDRAIVFVAAEDEGTLLPLGVRGVRDWDRDGALDPLLPGPNGQLVVRAAPPHDGLEGHRYVALAMTLHAPVADESVDPPVPVLLRSGLRVDLGFPSSSEQLQPLSFGRGFVESLPTVQLADRTFTYATVAGTGLVRIDLGGEFADGWSVYLPPSSEAKKVTLPLPPDGYSDVLTERRPGGAASRILVQSLVLRPGTNVDLESVATFGDVDPAAIGEATEAWTTTEIR